MSTLAKLKKKSQLSDLTKTIEENNSKPDYSKKGDDNFWKLSYDQKTGVGNATIRFLPEPAVDGDEAVPYIRYWDHGFKVKTTGKYYIERSRTSLGKNEPDPCAEYNSYLWNTGAEEDKQLARDQKRRLHHVANILVIDDPANPENNGKVFKFKFGKKIMEMIEDMAQPEFEDQEKVNVFNMWEGANFRLRRAMVDRWPNYNKSTWDSPSELFDGDDEKKLEVWKQCHSLSEIMTEENFGDYDTLLQRLNRAVGFDTQALINSAKEEPARQERQSNVTENTNEQVAVADEDSVPFATDDDDDEDLEYFEKLAEG